MISLIKLARIIFILELTVEETNAWAKQDFNK